MAEHKANLTGQVFNGLEVLRYNSEASKRNNNAYYICKCVKCGKEHSYRKSSLIALKASCACTGGRITNMIRAKLDKGREEAEKYINTKNGESSIVAYNEELSMTNGETTVDLICSNCGKKYSASLSCVKKGRYKICTECSRKGVNNSRYKDLSGQTIGLYDVISYVKTENNRSWWKCIKTDTLEECVVNADTLYQSRKALAYKYIRNGQCDLLQKKVPFTFVNIKN